MECFIEFTFFRMLTLSFCFIIALILFDWKSCIMNKIKVKRGTSVSQNVPIANWFKIPLPKTLIALWALKNLGERSFSLFKDKCQKYGKIYVLPFGFLNIIVVTEAKIVQKILMAKDYGYLSKSNFLYKLFLMKEYHGSLFASNRQTWQSHRQCLSKGFSYNALKSYLPSINGTAKLIVADLSKHFNNLPEIESADFLMNVICTNVIKLTGQLLTGSTWNMEDVNSIYKRTEMYNQNLIYKILRPHLFVPALWKLHTKHIQYENTTVSLHQIFEKIIKKYQIEKGNQNGTNEFSPLIDHMIQKNFSMTEILNNFSTMIFAELESTCTAIEFLLMHLTENLQCQNFCLEEIASVFETKSSESSELDIEDLTKLKYLERCILETLRLTPSIPILGRKIFKRFEINDNCILQPGSTLVFPSWIIHRDPEYFECPEKFDPDRFLPENTKTRPPGAFIPFSLGLRNCIGWKLGIMQIKIISAWLLYNFELSPTTKNQSLFVRFAVKLAVDKKYRMNLKWREHSSSELF